METVHNSAFLEMTSLGMRPIPSTNKRTVNYSALILDHDKGLDL